MIGDRIKELRIKNGETQETLAKAIGVTAQAVSKWENNITTPDISLLVPIADYFTVTTDYLLREPWGKTAKPPIDTASIIKYVYSIRMHQGSHVAVYVNLKNITERRISEMWYKAKFYDLEGVQVDERINTIYDLFPNVTKRELLLSLVTSMIARVEIEVTEVEFAED